MMTPYDAIRSAILDSVFSKFVYENWKESCQKSRYFAKIAYNAAAMAISKSYTYTWQIWQSFCGRLFNFWGSHIFHWIIKSCVKLIFFWYTFFSGNSRGRSKKYSRTELLLQLQMLRELQKSGSISREEFEEQKRNILRDKSSS